MCQLIRSLLIFWACVLGAVAPGGGLWAQGTSEVYFGVFYKPVCERLSPGFTADTAATYPAWEQRNHAAVAALESNAEFQSKRREALIPPPAELADAKTRELSVTCERLVHLYDIAAPADARFEAPERTWDTFRKALREGDRNTIRICLTGEARKGFATPLHAMTDEQLKRMADAVAELKLMQRSGDFQEGMVVQRDGAAGRIAFVKTGANWRIGQM